MNSVYHYKILPDCRLIISHHKGLFTFKNFLSNKVKQINDNDFNSCYNQLYDLTESTVQSVDWNIEYIHSFISENPNFFQYNFLAVLTATPEQVAAATIFKHFGLKNSKPEVLVCSTLDCALKFLLAKKHKTTIQSTLSQFSSEN